MRIYCDTNLFIVAVERRGPVSDAIWKLIERAGEGRRPLITSELTIAEALVGPLAEHRSPTTPGATPITTGATYLDVLTNTRGIELVPVDRSILVLAAYQRAESKAIKLPDAIHLATAESPSCTHFITGDRRLLRNKPFESVDLTTSGLDGLLETLP